MEKSLNRQVEKGKLAEGDRDAALGRVTGTSDLSALKGVDLVIESVVEDLAVKKELFNELDRITGEGTILATNTSTLPVIELAMQTGRPEKVCGVHFFNPAPVMELVELVRPSPPPTRPWPRPASSPRRAGRPRSRSRTRPASSSTPCSSPT